MRKKLAIISNNFPYPISHGGAVAQYFFLEKLCKTFDITFITKCISLEKKIDINKLSNLFPEISFVYFEDLQKEKTKKSQDYYIDLKIFIYNFFVKLGLINKEALIDYPLKFKFSDEKYVNFIMNYFENNQFDYVQTEFFETLFLADYLPKNSIKIFVNHEIRYKTLGMQKNRTDSYLNSIKTYELSKLQFYDRIIVFNTEDQELLKGNCPDKEISVSPFGILNKFISKNAPSAQFEKFLFIGGDLHYPNKEGLEWFLDNIYLPNYNKIRVPIVIVGNWKLEFIKKYKKYKKIVFKGFVDKIELEYENAVLLSPILSGSGLRTKILQAFANYIPVFSTKLGAEGLLLEENHIIIFDEHNFLKKMNENFEIIKLQKVAFNANKYYNKYFITNKLLEKRIKIYHD